MVDAPLQQFVRGQAEKLSVELFFDTTEDGMGTGATSVTGQTDRIYELIKISPERHAPPIVTFYWNDSFPGDSLDELSGNQRRNSFTGIAENVTQKFTLFSTQGVPLRAVVTLRLREYRTLEDQLTELRLMSPDHTRVHVLQDKDRLSALAGRYYRDSGQWRDIAENNEIEDPRRLEAGAFIQIPPIE